MSTAQVSLTLRKGAHAHSTGRGYGQAGAGGILGFSTHWPLDGCAGVTQDNRYHSRVRDGAVLTAPTERGPTPTKRSFRKGGLSPQ